MKGKGPAAREKKKPRQERPLEVPPEGRAWESTRRALAEGEARYREYWESLSPRMRDLLPAPGA